MLLRSCVLTAWGLPSNVRRVLAERRTRLLARYVVALRGRRVRRPCGELPSVPLRVVRRAALRIELLRASGIAWRAALRIELLLAPSIAWRARGEGPIGIGATSRAGRVILRTGEGIVTSSAAVLDRTVVVG